MKLDPGAGSLKTSGSERIIPLHPALIENGFLKFVAKIKSGPLFASLSPDKFGKRGGNGTKVIGRFVRQLGLRDTRLCSARRRSDRSEVSRWHSRRRQLPSHSKRSFKAGCLKKKAKQEDRVCLASGHE
jgi:hypothetical protein